MSERHGVRVAGDVVVGGWTNPLQMDIDPDPVDELLVGTPGLDDSTNRSAMLSKFDSTGESATKSRPTSRSISCSACALVKSFVSPFRSNAIEKKRSSLSSLSPSWS